VMSGTSLDGVDLALLQFNHKQGWHYSVLAAVTLPYSEEWVERLRAAVLISKKALSRLNQEYTLYLAEIIKIFLAEQIQLPDFISSHGHTVLHQPESGITLQIGNLPLLAQATGYKVICDFRVGDVALKGQGAPLVPGGEVHLFNHYSACVNLGGFANISLLKNDPVLAYDICPVNIVLNALVQSLGKKYDHNGDLARSGQLIPSLLFRLNQLSYYNRPFPKSLGIEWVREVIDPLLKEYETMSITDLLYTFSEHCAIQIARQLPAKGEVLFTGGGCYNLFLMEQIRSKSKANIVIPSPEIIEFKEAIVFAFLGVLREQNLNNCLASVTGAQRDHSSGNIFFP